MFNFTPEPIPQQSPKQNPFNSAIKIATAVLVVVLIFAFAILVVPRFLGQVSPEPAPQFRITSQSHWWTTEEIPDGIGGEQVLHVKVAVENYGEAAGVCLVNVKVVEPGGRFWIRFRIVSVSPGDTEEEQFDFPEVVDENVEYTAWLTDQ